MAVKVIQDVIPPDMVKRLPSSEKLIATLYIRGVTIQDIFGKYYEYDEHAGARTDELFGNDEDGQHGDPNRFKPRLTVGDAELAGMASLPEKPVERQPF